MANRNNRQVNYPELLNFFYDCHFPCRLKGNAVAIAHAIMQKWNRLIRPPKFEMSNKELSYLSGVDSHVGRSRQQLLDIAKVNGNPLFIYISQGHKKAGIYKINTTILPVSSQYPATIQPLSGLFGNDPKEKESKGKKEEEVVDAKPGDFDQQWISEIQKLAQDWWGGHVKLSITAVNRMFYFTQKEWPPTGQSEKNPLEFWREVIESMSPDQKDTHAGSILKYGKKMWDDWRKKNIQVFW